MKLIKLSSNPIQIVNQDDEERENTIEKKSKGTTINLYIIIRKKVTLIFEL